MIYTLWTMLPTNTAMALCAIAICVTILAVRWPVYIVTGLGIVTLIVIVTFSSRNAKAGTECTTRKSGSVTIETCTNTKRNAFQQCRSYMSGSVRKTSCRS